MNSTSDIELAEAEFFRALPPERLSDVRRGLSERRFEARKVLFFEGEPADHLWLVRAGEVRLYKSSVGGRTTTLESLGPGRVFGALSALAEDRYPVSAEAVTDGTAWCLSRNTVFRLLEQHPILAQEILRIVTQRLRDAHERVRSFAQDPAPARLAGALLRAARAGEARVTRRSLAEASGTSVETAIRVLRRFERMGAIRGEIGRVQILDEPALRRIAGCPEP